MKTTTNNKDHQNSKTRQVGGGGANDLSINNSAKNKAKVLLPPPSSAVSRSKHNSGSAKNDNSKPNPILSSNNPNNNLSSNSSRFLQFVGTSCGHHASYTFYKAIKYMKNGQTHILGLGEFFFVKIWPNSDLVAIGELQLLWEDRNTNQILSSTRLYFLPEYTPEGRTHHHGEDELVSVSEKAVLRVSDLLDWIANPSDIDWDRGILGVCHDDCVNNNTLSQNNSSSKAIKKDKTISTNGGGQESPQSPLKEISVDDKNKSDSKENTTKPPMLPGGVKPQCENALNAKFSPGYHEFLADINKEKENIGDTKGLDDLAVIILSHSQYSRYRSVLKRIAGCEKKWMNNSLIVALGGFTTPTRRTYVLFCRDNFDYAELEEHPHLCNHLAPKLKGRPRKRKPRQTTGVGSPAESEASSESSASTSVSISAPKLSRNGIKKDLLQLLSQKSTKEEHDFLKKLISFMDKRNTPIERPPMLGFKQIDLHAFFEKVVKLGGYDGCVHGKAWKSIYDELGGNPQNTSAATCTRRHYERFLLPYERHTRAKEERKKKKKGDQDKDGGLDYSSSSNRSSRRSQGASSPAPLDLKYVDEEDEVEDDSPTLSEKDGTLYNKDGTRVEPNVPIDASKKEDEDKSSNDLAKRNPLLTPELQNLMDSKQDSHMRIDPDGKRLQIDDLIIIPNNLHTPGAAGTEGTGSALQNLAKIASRYQNSGAQPGVIPGLPLPPLTPSGSASNLAGVSNLSSSNSSADPQAMEVDPSLRRRSGSSDSQSINMAKKPRMDISSPALASKNPGELDPKLLASGLTSSQLQQSLLNMFPPNLLAGLPPSVLSGALPGISSAQAHSKGMTGSNSPSNKPTPPSSLNSSNGQSSTSGSASKSDASSVANANNCMQLLAACSMAGLPPIPLPSDLSKLGPEGLNLLQMYEKHLRQIATSMGAGATNTASLKNGHTSASTSAGGGSSLANTSSTKKENANQNSQSHKYSSGNSGSLNSSGASQSVLNTVKDKDRNKVCKPPPDTKRPPSLMQTPCAFKQTTSIYTNPLAELTKAREAAAANASPSNTKSAANQLLGCQGLSMNASNMSQGSSSSANSQSAAPLDLTATPKKLQFTGKSPPPLTSPKLGMGLNLKKESSLLKPGAIGSSGQENASSSAKNQPALDQQTLTAILNLDPSKLDPATALLQSQIAQQLAANPQLLNPASSSYMNLAALGIPSVPSSLSSGSSSVKNETKVSPFSAEALLSKPSPSKLQSASNAYSELQSSLKNNPNSMSNKSLYPSSMEGFGSDRRLSNSSPAGSSALSHSNSSKLSAAHASATALAFGLPIGASPTQPPRQSPSSSAFAAASSTSHSPSSSNTEKSNRSTVSPWHSNLPQSGNPAITPSPKHLNPSPAPSSKAMPHLTTNSNSAASALLDKLGLDKLGVDKQTLLKDPTFQSALLNLGIPPSLLTTGSSSSSSIPSTSIGSSMVHPQSSLASASNHPTPASSSGLSFSSISSTGSSMHGVASTSWASSLSNPSSSLSSAAQSQSLLSNPYFALMAGGSGSSASPLSASAAPGHPKSSAANLAASAALMDPATSAYYAALYSQQMFGAAGLNPYSGLPSGGVPRGAVPSVPGLDHMQAASLQAMMGGARPSSSPYGSSGAAAASAAAMASAMAAAAATNPAASSNPFGAYAGLGGLSGFPGLGGYPPSRKDP